MRKWLAEHTEQCRADRARAAEASNRQPAGPVKRTVKEVIPGRDKSVFSCVVLSEFFCG
jgi:hypothetical protein